MFGKSKAGKAKPRRKRLCGRMSSGTPGNSSVPENTVIHSDHQHANVLHLTEYVSLPDARPRGCQFNLI